MCFEINKKCWKTTYSGSYPQQLRFLGIKKLSTS